MLTGLSTLFAFLFGVVPYASTIKLPPIPSFWAEMAAVLLAGCWAASVRRSPPSEHRLAVPVVVLSFACLAGALLLQLVIRQPMFQGGPVLVVLALGLASLVALAAARVRATGESARVLDAWSWGLTVALVLNFVAVLAERRGIAIYIYHLGLRPPPQRAEGLMGQPNQLAVLAVLATASAHYLWLRGRLPSVGHLLLSVASAVVVAGSASRAGALLWIACAGMGAFALRDHPRRRLGWGLLASGVLLLVAAQLGWKVLDSGAATNATVLRSDSLGRIELLRDSWALLLRHPFAGVGWGNFMGARWTELSTSLFEPAAHHAHNVVAQMLVELGLVCGGLVLLLLGWALWKSVAVLVRRGLSPQQYLPAIISLLLAGYSLVEYPLWYTFFLLPFAMMLGFVEQRDFLPTVSSTPPGLRWIGWAVALGLSALFAVDYQRTEGAYSDLELQQRQAKIAVVTIPLNEAREVAALSAFDVYANLMYSRALAPDGLFMGYKQEIVQRAMLSMTNQETISREVALLVATGKLTEARELIDRTNRSAMLAQDTREFLGRLAQHQPPLAAFLKTLPPPIAAAR